MRKINDIRQDLNAAIAEYEAAATAEARDAAMAKVRAFAKELKEANEVESARQMAAEEAMRTAVKNAAALLLNQLLNCGPAHRACILCAVNCYAVHG